MKISKLILAGGTGYMGTVLAEFYRDKATEIIILTRKILPPHHNVRYVEWDARSTNGNWPQEIDGAEFVVNLAGKSVDCRYTEKNEKEIFRSRNEATAVLGNVIAQCKNPPKLWINMASATIYRHAEDRPMTEEDGEIGTGFSIDVCKAWEKCFFDCETPATRKVCLRVGIVMGKGDHVFPRLKKLAQFGLGGKQGSGRQMFTWVHQSDMAEIVDWAFTNEKATGIYNCTSPGPIPNKEVMKIIRKEVGVPFGIPSPEWMLTIGAFLLGTETELILKSRWVLPKRLLDEGYKFRFTKMENVVREIMC